MKNTHVEHELVAYLDGELNAADRARVEGHLARCPACAAALEELRALAGDLDATLDAALTPVRLSYAADRRIREVLRNRLERPRWRWSMLWQRGGLVAQAVMALVLIVFSLNTYQVFTLPAPAAPQETLVFGQDRFAPGSEAALRVIVRSAGAALGAAPVAGAEIVVSLRGAAGDAQSVYRGVTDASGSADVAFTVPAGLEGEADLVVETRSAAGEEQIVRPVTIQRAYKIYLASDKPAYRPGQTLHLRALVLDAVTMQPASGADVTLEVLKGGARVFRRAQPTSEYGVAAVDFNLKDTLPLGDYILRATAGDTRSERTITLDDYTLPPFRVDVQTERAYYAPGERVQGTVDAAYFFGKPVAEGIVVLNGYVDDELIVALAGETGAQGRYAFTFDLPGTLVDGALTIEVEVVDAAGQNAGIRQQIPIAQQPVLIKAVPESGELKPGVENVVYVMTALADGRPVQTALTIDAGGQSFELTTDAYGLAELRFTPRMDAMLDIVARVIEGDAVGAEGTAMLFLQSDRAVQTMLLRAERATYEVGETLRLEALLTGDATTVYLDVARARQLVSTLAAPVVDGRAVFALDLDAALVGALELRAYALLPDGGTVADSRIVVVDAPRRVTVDVTADQAQYRPGETARLRVETARDGAPVQSVLGIAVIDASVYALDTLPPGFARTYFLLDDALLDRRGSVAGLDVPSLLECCGRCPFRAGRGGAGRVGRRARRSGCAARQRGDVAGGRGRARPAGSRAPVGVGAGGAAAARERRRGARACACGRAGARPAPPGVGAVGRGGSRAAGDRRGRGGMAAARDRRGGCGARGGCCACVCSLPC